MYADVECMSIGDLNRLWDSTIGDQESKYQILAFNTGVERRGITNYFMGSLRNNPFFERAHKVLVQGLWNADGGRIDTVGMHKNPLLKGVPLMGGNSNQAIKDKEGNLIHGPEKVNEMLTDYIIQGQAMIRVTGLIDEETGWDGPQYWVDHVYGIEYMQYSQLMNVYTDWNGQQAWELMKAHLTRSFVVKLAQGFVVKAMGKTLGILWASNVGSDDVPGTYAHWC